MEIVQVIANYLWPVALGWNVFLFRSLRAQEKALAEHKLFVAQNYSSKVDLKEMFTAFENRFNEKIEMFVKIVQ